MANKFNIYYTYFSLVFSLKNFTFELLQKPIYFLIKKKIDVFLKLFRNV